MGDKDLLFEIADRQQGFFITRQAEECGFSRSNFHLKIRSGEWIKEMRSVYRLARYPLTERPELILWILWSCNRKGEPQGIWSHDTALDIHELSDVMPSKMHMSVPSNFRRRTDIPRVLNLHYIDIPESDTETRQGYRVTKPLRTLVDVINAGKIAQDQIAQALKEALQRGLISRREVDSEPKLTKIKETNEV
jgi:predicted transcriptional regulator of viral defense system